MFATIFVPKFSLQAMQRQEPELRGRCVALLDGSLPPHIIELSPEAEAHGVMRGMSCAQAQGRCPKLIFRRVGEVMIAPARDCLIQCAGTFSPWLEQTAEGVVTMEWRVWQTKSAADSRVATNEVLQDELGKMVDWMERFGFSAMAGAAANPDLAILAARCAKPVLVALHDAAQFLAPLPLNVLTATDVQAAEEEQENHLRMLRILNRWGIRTLGQLTTLPKAQLIARLGVEAGALWDRAAGCSMRLLRLDRVPERFVEVHEFEPGVETLEPLLFILRRFVEQLSCRLEAVHRVAIALLLTLRFDRSVPHERELKVPSPTAEVEVLFRMLSTHLESVTATSPVIAVELEARPGPSQRSQFDLFNSRLRDPNQFYETLARLTAMLGEGCVGTPVMLDSHRPDTFRVETPRFDELPTSSLSNEPQRYGLPLRRFRPPLRVRVQLQSGYPVFLHDGPVCGVIEDAHGPWFCSGEWWTAESWMRVEWDVRLGNQLCRIACEPDGWRLDGIYD